MEFWQNDFQTHILERGREYFEKGKVKGYTQTEDSCMARVLGTHVYNVKISGFKKGHLSYSCNCPYENDWSRCKHEAALLFAWKDKNEASTIQKNSEGFLSGAGKTYYDIFYIINQCQPDSKTYSEAQRLVDSNAIRIENVKMEYRPYTSSQQVITFVGIIASAGDFGKKVTVTFDRNQLLQSRCEVMHRYNGYYNDYVYNYGYAYEKLCSHKLALLLLADKYIAKYNPGDATDYYGRVLLNSFKNMTSLQKIENTVEKKNILRLEPKLIYDDYDAEELLELSFKIGAEKLYVVKDFTNLVDRKNNCESMTFGKTGHINFVDEDFEDSAKGFYGLIEKVVKERKDKIARVMKRNHYIFPGEVIKNRIPLGQEALDIFYDLTKGTSVEFEDKYGRSGIRGNKLKVDDGKLTLKLEVSSYEEKGQVEGLSVNGRIPEIIEGRDAKYILDTKKNQLSRITQMSPLSLILMESADDEGVIDFLIGKKNVSDFYYRMLPEMEACPEIDIEFINAKKIDKFLPPEGKITFYMDADSDNIYGKASVKYDKDEIFLHELTNEDYPLPENRDYNLEASAVDALKKYMDVFKKEDDTFCCERNGDNTFEILSNGVKEFMSIGEVNGSKEFERLKIRKTPQIKFGVSIKSGILDLDISTDDMSKEELLKLLEDYRKKKKFFRLNNGEFVRLDNDSTLEELVATMEAMGITVKEFTDGKLHLPLYRALYINKLLEEHDEIAADRDKNFKGLIRNFNSIKESDVELPKELSGVLRGYQNYGFKWLSMLSELGFGGILADDMGLGKTLQMISLLLSKRNQAREEEKPFTALISCPASLVYNWQEEIMRFAPDLEVTALTGPLSERKKILAAKKRPEILVTSYDLLKRDIGLYEDLKFDYQIIDEAQYIKNASAAVSKAVKIIKSEHRFALTGTPIENRLSELWSIFDFLMPGFLYTYDRFKNDFENAITKYKDEAVTKQLKNMVSPFILRRLKENVLKDLPDKMEEVRYSKFESAQRKLYDAQVTHMKDMLESEEYKSGKDSLKILAELTRIRQICCDPGLITAGYRGESAKRESCMELIQSAIDGGHKILLFSQFTSMLELLEKDLKTAGIEYYKITGQTSKEDRIKLVHAFNENEVPLFLISLKAGGTGLNLTGADVVIHYDPWWNLAAQNQATDRAHRIGQTKKVSVFKLIVKNTIEEKILEMQNAKKDLADAILSGEGESLMNMSREQLMELLT